MRFFKNKKLFFISSLIVVLFVVGNFSFAQRSPEINYPTIGGVSIPNINIDLGQYIKYIFYFAISIAGVICFVALIFGGVRWLTSAGNPGAVSDAKDQLFSGILGLIILLGSWLFLNTINPQLVSFEAPNIAELPRGEVPSLKTGKVCFYDKKCGESDRKLLNCIDASTGMKPTEGDIRSVEIKEGAGSIAVGFFEKPLYDGRRICLKDASDFCDLTKFSFSGAPFDDIINDINSVSIIPAEKCVFAKTVLPAGPKDDFSAAVVFYKNTNYTSPAVLTFFGAGEGTTSPPPDTVQSIWINNNSSLAVRLFSQPNYGLNGGKTICFTTSVPNLSSYTCEGWWIFSIGWNMRIASIKVINASECPRPGITEDIKT